MWALICGVIIGDFSTILCSRGNQEGSSRGTVLCIAVYCISLAWPFLLGSDFKRYLPVLVNLHCSIIAWLTLELKPTIAKERGQWTHGFPSREGRGLFKLGSRPPHPAALPPCRTAGLGHSGGCSLCHTLLSGAWVIVPSAARSSLALGLYPSCCTPFEKYQHWYWEPRKKCISSCTLRWKLSLLDFMDLLRGVPKQGPLQDPFRDSKKVRSWKPLCSAWAQTLKV